MKIDKIHKRLVYWPRREDGLADFNGNSYVSEQVLDLIGQEGVDFINSKLQEYIKIRKEMFGDGKPEYYGMFPIQRFYDLKERVAIKITAILDSNNGDYQMDIGFSWFGKTGSNISVYKLIKNGEISENMD